MRPDDADRVGQLTLAAYDRYGHIDGDYRDFLADPLARLAGCSAVLVAEDRATGELLGTVSYVTPGDAEWEDRPERAGDVGFRILAVDPAAEGRGVGTALIDACFARARASGCRRMLITSMSWMSRAHDLYVRRYGFVRRPDLDVMFPNGPGIVFAADLTADAADHFPAPGPVPAEPPWYEDVWTS